MAEWARQPNSAKLKDDEPYSSSLTLVAFRTGKTPENVTQETMCPKSHESPSFNHASHPDGLYAHRLATLLFRREYGMRDASRTPYRDKQTADRRRRRYERLGRQGGAEAVFGYPPEVVLHAVHERYGDLVPVLARVLF
jgi:hypothetical protein